MGSCPVGTHDCSGLCASDSSVNSCGKSCTPCAALANATSTCDGGTCAFQCSPGFKICNGACISSSLCCTNDDCRGGACMTGKCCPIGQLSCGGSCVDPMSDGSNCGGCGQTCHGRCSMGICCGANQTACGGTCFDTQSDPMHCGPNCSMCALGLLCTNGACLL
jgi:hypothetical protein